MVKLYASTYTYLPFIYLYMMSVAVGIFYHSINPILRHYRPFTVLVFLLINTIVYRYYKSRYIIRNVIHKSTWKCVTYAVYGIMGNLIHEMVFHDHHFDHYNHNATWSLIYVLIVIFWGYYMKSPEALNFIHMAFLFIPIKRAWQVNLHMYTIFISLSVYMMYSKINTSEISDINNTVLPLLRYFAYIRLQDELIVLGFIQLYIEYYQRYIPDMNAAIDIEETISFQTIFEDDDDDENGENVYIDNI